MHIPDLSFRAIDSPLLEFVVGEEEKKFSVHRGVFSGISPSFKTMMDGFVEFRSINWLGIRVDTFLSLIQFAYTGDYVFTGQELDGGSTTTKTGIKRKREVVDAAMIDYSALFLGHARLYAYATRYHADDLQKLILDKFVDVFNHYSEYVTYHSGSLQSLTELLEYVFSHPEIYANEEDGLRKLVLEYVVDEVPWSEWVTRFFEHADRWRRLYNEPLD